MQRYGASREKVEALHRQVTGLAAEEGLDYHLERAHPVNSFDAHRLIHLAGHHHLQGEMKERLQRAYFTEGLVISDHDTLARLAVEVGLDGDETRRMLEGDAYAAAVRPTNGEHRRWGATGCPFLPSMNAMPCRAPSPLLPSWPHWNVPGWTRKRVQPRKVPLRLDVSGV